MSDELDKEVTQVIRLLSLPSAKYLHEEWTNGDQSLVKAVLTRLRAVLDDWEKHELSFDPPTLQILLDSLVKQFSAGHLAIQGIINSKFDQSDSGGRRYQ